MPLCVEAEERVLPTDCSAYPRCTTYRVIDVASVSSVAPFVYIPHYRDFFVWHQQHSVWGLSVRTAASTSCIFDFSSWQATANCTWGFGRGANQASQRLCELDYYVTLLRTLASKASMFHRSGRSVYLHPSAFWCTFATREGALHTTYLWYRSAFFDAILITIIEPSHRHMTVTFPPKDGTIQSPRPTYKHKQ